MPPLDATQLTAAGIILTMFSAFVQACRRGVLVYGWYYEEIKAELVKARAERDKERERNIQLMERIFQLEKMLHKPSS